MKGFDWHTNRFVSRGKGYRMREFLDHRYDWCALAAGLALCVWIIYTVWP